MATRTLLTIEQFERLASDSLRHELNCGELVTVTAPKFLHTRIAHRVYRELSGVVARLQSGEVYLEAAYLLSAEPPILRVPDVSFLRTERISSTPLDEYVNGAPELAVEIVSPSESAEDLAEKIQQYLHAGARAVWVVYPKTRQIHVHRADGNSSILDENQRIEDRLLFEDWSTRVGELLGPSTLA